MTNKKREHTMGAWTPINSNNNEKDKLVIEPGNKIRND